MLVCLSNSDLRKISFIEILYFNKKTLPLSVLSKKLNCSKRVLQNDIEVINTVIAPFAITSTNEGILLKRSELLGFNYICHKFLMNSEEFRFLGSFAFFEQTSLNELNEKLYMSSSTAYRYLSRINSQLEKWGAALQTNDLTLVGDEKNIRLLYTCFFSENFDFLAKDFSEQLRQFYKIAKIIGSQFITENNLAFDYNDRMKMTFSIVSSMIRLQSGNSLSTKTNNDDFFSKPLLLKDHEFCLEFQEILGFSYTYETHRDMLFMYYDGEFALNTRHALFLIRVNPAYYTVFSAVENFVENLINILPTLTDYQNTDISIKLTNYFFSSKRPMHFFYDPKKQFLEKMRKTAPKVVEDLTQLIKENIIDPITTNKKTSLSISKDFLDVTLAFLLSQIPELTEIMPRKKNKIKTLFISNSEFSFKSYLLYQLEKSFPNQLEFSSFPYHDEKDEALLLKFKDYQLVVSSSAICPDSIPNAHFIHVEPTFTEIDKLNIAKVIDNIHLQET